MKAVKIQEGTIRLGQALKLSAAAESGADAKHAVLEGRVKVNGQTEYRRGRKLSDGDVVEYAGETLRIEA